jgi:hypothetical protein
MSNPILVRARELIADPANWVKGEYAQGSLADPATHCFCLIGAVDRAVLEKAGLENYEDCDENILISEAESDLEAIAAIQKLQSNLDGLVSDFNDDPETTHADVLALLDKVIAA